MLVPKLRFKEFYDDWIIYKFYDLVTITNGQVNPNDMLYCNLPHIGPGNIEKNTGRLLQYNLAKDDKLISNKYLFDEKSVIYGKINPQFAKVCFPKFRGLCSADAYPLNPSNDKLNSAFLLYLLLNKNFTKFAISVSMRTGMPKINREELSMYKFKVPSIIEQEKIANFLSLLDKKIELQQRKIEALKIYKKGLIQRIFNNKYNNCMKIEELIFQKSTRNSKNEIKDVYSVSNKDGFILQSEHFKDRMVASEDTTNYKIIENDDFAYNPARINVGSIARMKKNKNGIISPMYICFKCNEKILPEYLEYFFESPKFIYEMNKRLEGSVRMCLSYESMINIPIEVPDKKEQEKTSNILTTLDKKVYQEEKRYTKLNELKNGLLQKMFV